MQLNADQVFDPVIGAVETLEPGLRRILAPNPSPMTFRGTNTYLLGTCDIAVIDPGPDSPAHLEVILGAIGPDQRISHIFVTHSHLDHSPLARPLAEVTGAPVLAFGPSSAGRSTVMKALSKQGLMGGGEGVDDRFAPDIALEDGAKIQTDKWALEVIHTPGHMGNHIALGWGDACFTADHVMGWATSIVSPPDGDLTDFMASSERLLRTEWRVFYPGHGAPITAPADRLGWLIAHRRSRERAILSALDGQDLTARALAHLIYQDTPQALLPAATRNVLAHLVDLYGRGWVETTEQLSATATFRLQQYT
ncbi:MAG: MBL fold metallo-hydrolase [Paracoccaceae bacterium]